eukprot:6231913-Pyramimonas_sp.AAC.1
MGSAIAMGSTLSLCGCTCLTFVSNSWALRPHPAVPTRCMMQADVRCPMMSDVRFSARTQASEKDT